VAKIQSKSRLGLTATPVRESGNPEDIYSLIGPPVGTDWHKLFNQNYVQKPEVTIEKIPWSSQSERDRYERVSGHMRRRVAAENPKKLDRLKHILRENPDDNIIVFVEWINQGEKYSDELNIPFICGETPHDRRDKLFNQMRSGGCSHLIISRVGDEGIDIPNVDLCVICSTLGGSSSQTAQRVGRTMRPTGSSKGILLATKGSNEEDFIRSSTEYLAEQGIEVTIKDKSE
jgi:DNA excision repair protein ERCC-3